MHVREHLYYTVVYISVALAGLLGTRVRAEGSTPVYLTLTPGESTTPLTTLGLRETQKLRFVVGGVTVQNVTWSLVPDIGNISDNVYTAPIYLSQPEVAILIGKSGGQMATAIIN